MLRTVRRLGKSALAGLVGDDYPRLIRLGAIDRPHYAYIVYQAADLARRLGVPRISVLEFGVAGGAGLLNLEYHARRVSALTGVGIDVYGFDTGMGLPPPEDYRDLPYVWQESHFKMDREALERRLAGAKLVLGLVKDTVRNFVATHDPAPIGAIGFDLDYYSSTKDALEILLVEHGRRLPRIFAYLDDIYSSDTGHVTPRVGVPLAVAEFIAAHPSHDVSPLTHLEYAYGRPKRWHHQIYSCGSFEHPLFNEYIVKADRQLSL